MEPGHLGHNYTVTSILHHLRPNQPLLHCPSLRTAVQANAAKNAQRRIFPDRESLPGILKERSFVKIQITVIPVTLVRF